MLNFVHQLHWPLSAVEHGALVLAGLLIYLTSTRLTRQHRHPSAALAWVLTIGLLPYLGIPFYLLFGVRKVPRPLPSPIRSRPVGDDMLSNWAQGLSQALSLPAPTRNDDIVFQPNGRAALESLLDLIAQARQHIDVCSFLLGNDETAAAICKALGDAAQRGVKVRVMLDALGSWSTSPPMFKSLRASGIEVRPFMPLLPNIRRGRVNLRNHRKLVVVDGRRVWSGGRNLAAEYFVGEAQNSAWADISFVVTGPLAAQARILYEQDWQVASGDLDEVDAEIAVLPPESPPHGDVAQWIPSGPDHAEDTAYAMLLAAAFRAEQRIVLISPYFVPDDALLSAWCMACRRGVRVTLVIPAKSNHRLADVARSPSLRSLMSSGAQVMLYPRMLHAKAVIIDQELALCGSTNLDSRSLFLNYELTTAFHGTKQIDWLADWAQGLIAESRHAYWQRPSAARELLEGLVRIVGFQL
ncbi:MAG: cardiolipin synthase [Burkholderiales bacterium]|jgi:cardiolipin synthase|nr:MAG: cardiolipin synthase [Burkholderiales bacterium]